MRDEILYSRALGDYVFGASLELPKFDMNEETRDPFYYILRSGKNVAFGAGRQGETNNLCPFIEKGATAIGWDGNLSPCLPLLHGNKNYLDGRERFSRKYAVGNVREKDLRTLWNEPEYLALRRRVKTFDFSPCYICGAVISRRGTKKIVLGIPFLSAGDACGPRGSSAVLEDPGGRKP